MPEPLRLERTLPATPGNVFDAWTVPDIMRRWLFASDRGELVRVVADPVVGGRYSILEFNDGAEIDHYGRYLIVDRHTRLSFTLDVPQHFNESTVIDLEFVKTADGCAMSFRQSGIDADKTRPFWTQMFGQLADTLLDSD